MTTAISTNTAAYLPLTTVFTPPAECTKYQLTCNVYSYGSQIVYNGGLCTGSAFPQTVCSTDATGRQALVGCYPESITTIYDAYTYTYGVATYLPGLACPLGMTTATSLAPLDGVFCCPRYSPYINSGPSRAAYENGLTYNSQWANILWRSGNPNLLGDNNRRKFHVTTR